MKILLLLLLVTSCASVKNKKIEVKPDGNVIETEIPEEVVEDLPVVEVEDVTEDKELFKVSKFLKFKQSEINKFYDVTRKHDSVTQSQCFRDFMTARNLRKTNGKTPEEVVDHLISEKPVIELEMYYSWKKVVGYTYPSSKRIWMNRRFHNKMSVCARAGNIGHERSHKLNYDHTFNKTKYRYLSVPYSINAAFKVCCSN